MKLSRAVRLLFLVLLTAHKGYGQAVTASEDTKDKTHFSLYERLAHSSGTLTLDTSVGYRFKHFGIDAGMPLVFTRAISTAATGSTVVGTTASGYYNNSVGNAYVDLTFSPDLPFVDFSSVLTGMAPSGSTAKGVSTGRVTFNWANHLDFSVSKISPFLSAGISDTVQDLHISPLSKVKNPQKFQKPYTTLGLLGNFEAGTNVDITDSVTVGASLYAVVPRGQQKVFSRVIRRTAIVQKTDKKGVTSKHRQTVAQLEAVAVGTPDATRDNGFSISESTRLYHLFNVDLGYTRSVPYATNTVTVGLGIDFWRLAKRRY